MYILDDVPQTSQLQILIDFALVHDDVDFPSIEPLHLLDRQLAQQPDPDILTSSTILGVQAHLLSICRPILVPKQKMRPGGPTA